MWDGFLQPDRVFNAKSYGNHCMQLNIWESDYFRNLLVGLSTRPSEDCLNLNIYTPTKERLARMPQGRKTKLPVMVFVHGGMFTTGGSSAAVYDPRLLVDRHDVVVVTLNYRLSIWGFLASRELEADDSGVGNYGLTDVLSALEWVHQYIAYFGGDATNVSLAGHSAGSTMVNHVLLTLNGPEYRERDLIHRVIMFSGSFRTGQTRDMLEAEEDVTIQPLFDTIVAATACSAAKDRLACLRAVPATELGNIGVQHQWAYHWGPVIDGHYIADTPMDMVRAGDFLQVPIFVTDCIDDGTIFSVAEPTVTFNDFFNLVSKFFGTENAGEIVKYYGAQLNLDGTPYFAAASDVFRDAFFTCAADEFAGTAAYVNPALPVYYHRFSTPLSLAWLVGSLPGVPDYGVFHGTELVLLFQGMAGLTIGQSHAVNTVQRRIVNFMRGGVPNDPKYPLDEPARIVRKPLDLNKMCYQWNQWPTSRQFLHRVK